MNNQLTSGWKAIALIVAVFLSANVKADGFYVGAGAYKTDISIDAFDDDDYAPAAFLGYQFLDTNILMLSAELGYYNLGEYDENNGQCVAAPSEHHELLGSSRYHGN